MSPSKLAGMTLRVLCLPIALQLLASCGHHPPEKRKPTEAEEFQQDVDAVKQSPSLQPGSNLAGPPLHFNPYPPAKGTNRDEHAHHDMSKH